MEIYTLSKTLQNEFSILDIVDSYTSLMWTEHFRDVGDFELNMVWSAEKQRQFAPGTFVSIPMSRRVMMVLSRSTDVNDEGHRTLQIKGESLEHIFKLRHFQLVWERQPYDALKTFRNTTYNDMCRWVIQNQMVENTSGNRIHNLSIGRPDGYPAYSDVPIVAPMAMEQGYIHDFLQTVTKQGNIGYRLVPRHKVGHLTPLTFDAYTPTDRTQVDDYVVFGEKLENVTNVKTFKSIEGYFNRIWINGYPTATTTLWHTDGALEADDFRRRLGYEGYNVKSQLEQEDNTMTAKEIARSKAEEFLSKVPPTFVVEGEVDHLTSTYEYDVDYGLGDLVHYIDVCDTPYVMRVMAQTFTVDENGTRTYPTLSEYNPYEVFNPGDEPYLPEEPDPEEPDPEDPWV